MITVKLKTVHNPCEIFETEKYIVSTIKEMHTYILEVMVYTEGRKIYHCKRHFQWFYKKFLYKPVQQEIKPEETE